MGRIKPDSAGSWMQAIDSATLGWASASLSVTWKSTASLPNFPRESEPLISYTCQLQLQGTSEVSLLHVPDSHHVWVLVILHPSQRPFPSCVFLGSSCLSLYVNFREWLSMKSFLTLNLTQAEPGACLVSQHLSEFPVSIHWVCIHWACKH